jgi:adenylate cyclase class IV
VERVNLELKVRDPHPEATAAACLGLGADEAGVLRQRDTYFAVSGGRLKVRQDLDAGAAELIFYERPTATGVRTSRYIRIPLTAPDAVRDILAGSLGIRGVVEKERRLFLYDNVRIHLDTVAGIGTFLELEGVLASPGRGTAGEQESFARVERALLGRTGPTIGGSYIDLVADHR